MSIEDCTDCGEKGDVCNMVKHVITVTKICAIQIYCRIHIFHFCQICIGQRKDSKTLPESKIIRAGCNPG